MQGGGFALLTRHRLDALTDIDTLIIPAWDTTATAEPEVLDAVRAVHDRGGRVVAVCSGAFLLAECGLLDGRRATTHWIYADALARRFPAVEVDPDVLYVDGGDGVFTSAGTAAGIDLCLHLVRADLGAEVANAVARRMVVPPHRTGGQAQYVAAPVAPAGDGGDGGDPLSGTLDWALEHLDEPLTVEILARRALQSPRTFARRFRERTGTTPLQWLLRQRILAAQQLLEAGGLPVELVAERCGSARRRPPQPLPPPRRHHPPRLPRRLPPRRLIRTPSAVAVVGQPEDTGRTSTWPGSGSHVTSKVQPGPSTASAGSSHVPPTAQKLLAATSVQPVPRDPLTRAEGAKRKYHPVLRARVAQDQVPYVGVIGVGTTAISATPSRDRVGVPPRTSDASWRRSFDTRLEMRCS